MDYRKHMPKRSEMPATTGGQLNEAWKELDRESLMGILATVREDFCAHMQKLGREKDLETDAGLAAIQGIRALTIDWLAKVPDEKFRQVAEGET